MSDERPSVEDAIKEVGLLIQFVEAVRVDPGGLNRLPDAVQVGSEEVAQYMALAAEWLSTGPWADDPAIAAEALAGVRAAHTSEAIRRVRLAMSMMALVATTPSETLTGILQYFIEDADPGDARETAATDLTAALDAMAALPSMTPSDRELLVEAARHIRANMETWR